MTNSTKLTTLDRWRTLLERIVYATNEGLLDWNEAPEANAVMTTIGDAIVTLSKVRSDYTIRITDEFGSIIDKFDDNDLGVLSDGSYALHVMSELHRQVQRQISGADKKLDSIINLLPKRD